MKGLFITCICVVIVLSIGYPATAAVDLSGEYWFGSLSVDVNTNAPLGKRGTLSIAGNQWDQEWVDYSGHHTFSSAFTTTILLDGSININFPGETYNIAWNGDVMIHAGSVLGGTEQGFDIFTRIATNVDFNDILGDHSYFGHHLNSPVPGDSCGWGNFTFDPNGTAIGIWTNDHGVIESATMDWTIDDSNSTITVVGPTINELGYATSFISKGGITCSWQIVPEEGRDDLGYGIFVNKTDEMIKMTDIADTYQIRFLETGPGGVPYICGQGLCVIGEDGSFSVDAYYSNGEHDVFSTTYTVGPGNEFHLDDDSMPDGIISPDKNLIFLPEYQYENPPTRTDDDWLGGIFLIRMPTDCKYLLDGDLNKDYRVDFRDFSILAHNWLVDCSYTPLDPACRCDIPWVAEPPMNVARDQFTGGVIDGKIYVFGGNGNPDGINLKSTEMYDPAITDPDINPWTMVADNPHNPYGNGGVEELTAAVVNDKLYVFGAWGGLAPDGYYGVFNFNEKYDPVTDTWETLAQKPTTVAAAPTTVYNDEIYLFSGYFDSVNPSQDHVDYNTVECYDPNSNTWRFVTNMPKTLSNFGIATIGDKAYLFGGHASGSSSLCDEVISYDFQTDKWTTSAYQPMPVQKAFPYSVSAPVIDGKVYLIGGWELIGSEFATDNRVDIYNPAMNTWEKGTPLPLPLGDHITLNIGTKIYVLGGDNNYDFYNRSKNEVISLDTEFCSK